MQVIEHYEVPSGGVSSITFDEIPTDGTYTDLMIVHSLRTNRSVEVADEVQLRFNNDTGNNYSVRRLYSYVVGGHVASDATTTNYLIRGHTTAAGATANTFGSETIYIPNYASSVAKSVSRDAVSENNGTEAWLTLAAGLWTGTAAINQIVLSPQVGSQFVQYGSATLYGILAGSDGTTTVS